MTTCSWVVQVKSPLIVHSVQFVVMGWGGGWVMGVKVLVVEETTLVAPVGKDWGCPVLEQLVPHC